MGEMFTKFTLNDRIWPIYNIKVFRNKVVEKRCGNESNR